MSRKLGVRNSSESERRPAVGSREDENEPLGSLKGGRISWISGRLFASHTGLWIHHGVTYVIRNMFHCADLFVHCFFLGPEYPHVWRFSITYNKYKDGMLSWNQANNFLGKQAKWTASSSGVCTTGNAKNNTLCVWWCSCSLCQWQKENFDLWLAKSMAERAKRNGFAASVITQPHSCRLQPVRPSDGRRWGGGGVNIREELL